MTEVAKSPSTANGLSTVENASNPTIEADQTRLATTPREVPVPARRSARLMHLGRLAGGIAGGVMAEGIRRVAKGRLPSAGDLLLTPGNVARLADRLSEMRGAAMKVGQLISMEAGEFLPPELTTVLAKLREHAHTMPLGQVGEVLGGAWGQDWPERFERFSFQPLAAASIGQVHEAVLKDGRRLAVKVQYPGVRQSIDSDVDNVASLLSWSKALPAKADLAPLLEEAKRQLHLEADYQQEAASLEAYAARLDGDATFTLPTVETSLTTSEVLAMSYVDGMPVEKLADHDQALRNRVATHLLRLSIREFLDWGLVQTDPNFANFRYDAHTGRIGLLDFGATRVYPNERVALFRNLLQSVLVGDRSKLEEYAAHAGYLSLSDTPEYRAAMQELLMDASLPVRHAGRYDFGTSDLASRMSEKLMALRFDQRVWRLPPPDILFLHRKLGGLYMLCARLRAQVDVSSLLAPYMET